MRRPAALLGLASVFLAASLAAAADRPLNVGDRAPDFTLADQDGKPSHLSGCLAARRDVVLAVSDKAFTLG